MIPLHLQFEIPTTKNIKFCFCLSTTVSKNRHSKSVMVVIVCVMTHVPTLIHCSPELGK